MALTIKKYARFNENGTMEYVEERISDIPNYEKEFSKLLSSGKTLHKKLICTPTFGALDVLLGATEAIVAIPRKAIRFRATYKDMVSTGVNLQQAQQYRLSGTEASPMFVVSTGSGTEQGTINTTVDIPMQHYLQLVVRRQGETQWTVDGNGGVGFFVKYEGGIYAPKWHNIHDNGKMCTGEGFNSEVGNCDSIVEAIEKAVERIDNGSSWNTDLADTQVFCCSALGADMKPVFKPEWIRHLVRDQRKQKPLSEALIENHSF